MNNDQIRMRRRVILGSAGIGLVVAAAIIGWFVYTGIYNAKLLVQVAPIGSTIQVNGKKFRAGSHRVRPGTMKVDMSRQGFSAASKTVEAVKGKEAYVGIVLESNDPSTAGWYEKHPKDQFMSTEIAGRNFDIDSAKAVSEVPFIKELPIVGPGLKYRIDYGEPLKPGSTKQGIYITGLTDQDQQDAVDWIKYKGYDPATLDIKFITGSVL